MHRLLALHHGTDVAEDLPRHLPALVLIGGHEPLDEVHDHVELDKPLPGGSGEKPEGGGVRLQDHGNPVRFRNIWVVPGK